MGLAPLARFHPFLQRRSHLGQVAFGSGEVGFELDRFFEVGQSLFKLALLGQCPAEVAAGLGPVGFQAQRFLVVADRFVQEAELVER